MNNYAIVGYGVEGRAAYEHFIAKVGAKHVKIFDDASTEYANISEIPPGYTLVRLALK